MRRAKLTRASGAVRLTVLVLVCCGRVSAAKDETKNQAGKTSWSYIAEVDGLRPIARSISLASDPPQDLAENVAYRGKARRYGQLRYGSENSRRVTIVVDEIQDGECEFYVDGDRDRRITEDDFIEGAGRTRTCHLETEVIRAALPVNDRRRVMLRLGVTGRRLSVATVGCIEGKIPWHGSAGTTSKQLSVRRIDGNANGLFADARDRLLIDVNDDGLWDPVSEQFAYLPVQIVSGRRYAVRSDRMGKRFDLSEVTGIGHLSVVVGKLPNAARVVAFEAMVFSVDGSAYSLKDPDEPLSVPVGRYTLGSVTMTIDAGESEPWHFVFSRSGSIEEDDWVDVAAEQDVELEAVGTMRFEIGVDVKGSTGPGDLVTVRPRIYTQDGLLINLSCRGRQMGSFDSERAHNSCEIKLTSASGETLSTARSGFA